MDTGLRRASVFPGFCKRHDNVVFSEIERNDQFVTKRQGILLGYRVICLEVFKKQMNIKLFSDPALQAEAKKNGSLKFIQAFIVGTQLGLTDLKRTKITYENALHKSNFGNFVSSVIELDAALPLCFASPFAPEFDFAGKKIIPDADDEWDIVAAFAGTIGGRSIFFAGGFQRPNQHDIVSYIDSMKVIPNDFSGSAVLHTALQYAENTFFRKSWVDSLDEDIRRKITSLFGSGTPGVLNSGKAQILSLADIIKISGRDPIGLTC